MNNKDLVLFLQAEIEANSAAGFTTIDSKALAAYLGQLADLAGQDAKGLEQLVLEKFRASHEIAITRFNSASLSSLEMFRTVIASGESAIKASMTINGGGAVAILAFIGHLVSSSHTAGLIGRFASPMGLFVGGVLGSAIAYGARYLTQWSYERRYRRTGHAFNIISTIMTAGTYVTFAIAAIMLYRIFASL